MTQGKFFRNIAEEKLKSMRELDGLAEYNKLVEGSTLNKDELMDYGKKIRLAGWHVKDVVVYDKPKELKELGAARAPQSWCYI